MRQSRVAVAAAILCILFANVCAGGPPWKFAVSGDSRNCGDVVMPAIAAGSIANKAEFYWHLGDYRAIYTFDQDYLQIHKDADIASYLDGAWQDFIENQLGWFGSMPVYLVLGNHETIPPMTREKALVKFADWLNAPAIREQRVRENPRDHDIRGYYHFVKDGIDFITLDNASADQFDDDQLAWIKALLARDQSSADIRALVVGMHEALPESISRDHSMSDSAAGEDSGRKVYSWLMGFKRASDKPVYVLASHSHFYMWGIYNTDYWQDNGGVLPGWIVGTAGAVRYALPPKASDAIEAKTNVYGYLIGSVTDSSTHPINFDFHELKESDVQADVVNRFTAGFVHSCWADNSQQN